MNGAECPACTMAQADAECGCYQAACLECSARMLAHGPEHYDAMAAAAFTPAYRSALQAVFGARWMEGHESVRRWSRRIEQQRRARSMRWPHDAA